MLPLVNYIYIFVLHQAKFVPKSRIMKIHSLIAAFVCLIGTQLFAQDNIPFTVSGKNIKDPCGNTFIPRGVNYSLLDDWNFPGNLNSGELSAQIIQANPNMVRIQWYVDYGQASRPAYSLNDLDSVISRFERAGIVSVMELHDLTGSMNYNAFNSQLLSWWTSDAVMQLINKHKDHVMVNFANEFGPAMYPPPDYDLNPNYASQIAGWVSHYENAISTMRNAGITVPLIIDASNYGLDLDVALNNGAALEAHDPLHNIIMSVHGYWDNTADQSAIMTDQIANVNFPIILGEIGNADATCSPINYTALLQNCQNKNIGWLAWTWNRDGCAPRNMTANSGSGDGQFSSLTGYGNTIVNNPDFGLAAHAQKACFDNSGTGIKAITQPGLEYYPNPVKDVLTLKLPKSITTLYSIIVTNVNGQAMKCSPPTINNNNELTINVSALSPGIYFLQYNDGANSYSNKIVKE